MLPLTHLKALAYKENKMAVKVEYTYTKADGSTPISLDAWAATLPADRQSALQAARERLYTTIASAKTSGKILSADETGAVYADADAHATLSAPEAHDAEFTAFWDEYLTVNGITFNRIVTEV
jgi:hypothetical protein